MTFAWQGEQACEKAAPDKPERRRLHVCSGPFSQRRPLQSGDKISVEELSRELGVSRTPLWGAINRLEAEGIVEIVPRQGVYLVNYDPERALEIYVAREALEGMAARLAAEKITDKQLGNLKAKLEEQRSQLAKGDVERYYTAALEFHELVLKIADS